MDDPSNIKHFVDSSVAQPMLLGSSSYKRYFKDQFEDRNIYISNYVQMEIKRSCIAPFIHFYFLLDMPNIKSLGDALAVWSNSFSGREIKAVERLIAQLIDTHQLNDVDPKDKPKVLRRLGLLIKRVEGELRRKFINIGTNTARCARAEIPLVSSQVENLPIPDQLRQFIEAFEDVRICRSQCRVDSFIISRFQVEIRNFLGHAANIDKPNSKENKGFVEITKNLQEIIETGGKACNCRMCGRIGDAIIALETPENMYLEHTDYSFDKLCELTNKPHKRHPSEREIQRNVQGVSPSSREN